MSGFLLVVCSAGIDGVFVNLNYVGLTAPIPLIDGFEVPWGITWSAIPEFETPGEKCMQDFAA